ncbi:MAG: hypothetical protein J7L66_01790 [Anaerolineaceae bacterium]|nr:hypothetical protein [Anaerolineaceae bacterium]
MKTASQNEIHALTERILTKRKYRFIHRGLVESIARVELSKGRKKKEAEKAVLGKLHQVGAAYFAQKPDYLKWIKALSALPKDLRAPEVKTYCKQIMKSHYSTEERLPLLNNFYKQLLTPLKPIHSILDLACGLNPLAIPWMPLEKDTQYYGCDIFSDLTAFLNDFSGNFEINGNFKTCNILEAAFKQPVKVAFILKTLPCLEQLRKGFIPDLLDAVPAEYILLSYPISSLSGKAKGMRKTYANQCNAILNGKGWSYERYEFSSELVFIVKKR